MAGNLLTSPLNKIPWGLLDFFGIKSMGQAPASFGTVVQPTLDMFRLYADDNSAEGYATLTSLVANTNAGVLPITSANWLASGVGTDFANGASSTVVPNDEIWFILEAGCEWGMDNAGHVADFSLCATLAQRSLVLTDGVGQGYTAGGPTTRVGRKVMTKPYFVARGGSQLNMFCFGASIPAGTITIACNARIARQRR